MSDPVDIPRAQDASGRDKSLAVPGQSFGDEVNPSPPACGASLSKSPDVQLDDLDELDRTGIPLNSAWTFWFDRSAFGTSAADYTANMKKLYTVHTIQSFWGLYNTIPVVSLINNRCSYHLMRDSRRPLWEDEQNAFGGTWKIRIGKDQTERVWKEVILAMIGEQFADFIHEDDNICGASVSVRTQGDVIQLWNVNASVAPQARVLDKIRQILPDVEFGVHFYKPHQEHAAYDKNLAKR